jgi:quercetin dioxygenase-like cupin family protein
MRPLLPFAVALLACGCAAPPEGTVRVEIDLPEQAARVEGGPVAAALLHGDDDVSVSVVRLSGPIARHRHRKSEEIVYLVSGAGILELPEGPRALRAGDLVVVPRNTPHGFTPTGDEPALVLQLFTPPFVEGDRVFEGDATVPTR